MDRKTPMTDGELLVLGVAASTKVEAGHLGAVNASGYLVPAGDTAGLKVIGRFEQTVDNTSGANGDLTCEVRRRKAFKFDNSATNALTVADIGGSAYVEDSETVGDNGATNDIVAGKVLNVESDGVWIEVA